ISVVFRHRDPAIVQPVVGLLITNYLKKHIEVHRPAGALDELRKQTDELGSDLRKSETELGKLMSEAGIISLDDAKKYAELKLKIKEKLDEAEVDLAARQASLGELKSISTAKTNQVASPGEPEPESSPELAPDKIEEYKS